MEKPAGYAWLIERLGVRCATPSHTTLLGSVREKIALPNGRIVEILPRAYDPGEDVIEHLELALKYDDLDLGPLSQILPRVDPDALAAAIREQPTSKYMRRLWFLYEWLTGRELDVPPLSKHAYIDLLEPETQFVGEGTRSARQRVNVNLLGTRAWCPRIRKTERLQGYVAARLSDEATRAVASVDPELLRRAIDYFYTRETHSSLRIEAEAPSSNRQQRFVSSLRGVAELEALTKEALLRLQNEVVLPHHAESDYRGSQNYVGMSQMHDDVRHRVRYVCPRPEDVPDMMEGFLAMTEAATRHATPRTAAEAAALDPVVAAALVAFSFVYIHPFEDGNGRLHRLLIHYVLSRTRFTPPGLVIPVSWSMIRELDNYYELLGEVSSELLKLVRFDVNLDGELTAEDNDADLYRFVDLTSHAEATYAWLEQAIRHDFQTEFGFLRRYDLACQRMRAVDEMPDRLEDLFIRVCRGNGYRLSANKRASHFAWLTDVQVAGLERAVHEAFTRPLPELERADD